MYKKNITYVDYDGVERSEDFYFNLTKAELIEMQMSFNGGMERYLNKIITEKDTKNVMAMFKEIILKAYGEKSLDGKRFVKNQELSDGFAQTEAYSELIIELLGDPNKASEFIKAVMPKIPEDHQKPQLELAN